MDKENLLLKQELINTQSRLLQTQLELLYYKRLENEQALEKLQSRQEKKDTRKYDDIANEKLREVNSQ